MDGKRQPEDVRLGRLGSEQFEDRPWDGVAGLFVGNQGGGRGILVFVIVELPVLLSGCTLLLSPLKQREPVGHGPWRPPIREHSKILLYFSVFT